MKRYPALLSLILILAIWLLPIASEPPNGWGPLVVPGQESTYIVGMPEVDNEQQWATSFYETYTFEAANFSDALDPDLRDGEQVPPETLVVLGANVSAPLMASVEPAEDSVVRVASGEVVGCAGGCWIATHQLPRVCNCVIPNCSQGAFPDACTTCQRGYGTYSSEEECKNIEEEVLDQGLSAGDYPKVADPDDIMLSIADDTCVTNDLNLLGIQQQQDLHDSEAWDAPLVPLVDPMQPMIPFSIGEEEKEEEAGKPPQPNNACPHMQPGLVSWDTPALWPNEQLPRYGSDVSLPPGVKVLLSTCSLRGMPEPYFRRIYVPETSELIFADTSLALAISEIRVDGALRLGSPTCRLASTITITFRKYEGIDASNYGIDTGNRSQVDIHGRLYSPTWTRLATMAPRGSSTIFLQDKVLTWQPGQRIVLVSTAYKDLFQNQNEVLVVSGVSADGRLVSLEEPLQYDHYGGPEYQAEVGLLSRSIRLLGSQDTVAWGIAGANARNVTPMGPTFGPHIRFTGKIARISGTYIFNAGQTNELGRYALHFHMMGSKHNSSTAFVKDSTIHESNFRCVSVHSSNGMLFQDNVAFWVTGNCFYLESGSEERNTFDHNMVAYVLPIKPLGGVGQDGDVRVEGEGGVIEPADSAAAAYYGTNLYNTWTNNAGSGGFFVYSFPVLPRCIREFASDPDCRPVDKPFIKFSGNSAHSSGYLWDQGACLYTGGLLEHRASDGKLVYYSGRKTNRHTRNPDGSRASINVTNFRAALCGVGILHWGQRIEIDGYHAHDMALGANLLNDATVRNSVINMRTPNRAAVMDRKNHWEEPKTTGFGWYDTRTRTVLINVEFRNFMPEAWKPASHRCALFTAITKSDFFKPDVMSYSKRLRFTNCDLPGSLLRLEKYDSGAYRFFQWIDVDGSVTGWGQPSIIGSETSFSAVGDSCTFVDANPSTDTRVFMCQTDTKLARMDLHIPKVTNTYDHPPGFPADSSKYGLGTVFQMGYTGEELRWTVVTRNSGMVGPTGKNGWYFTFLGNACPKMFLLYIVQVPVSSPAYVAMRYPQGTTFKVERRWSIHPQRNQACRDAGGRTEMVANNDTSSGCVYHWDGVHLYLKASDLDWPRDLRNTNRWIADDIAIVRPRSSEHWFEVTTNLDCGGEPMCDCNVEPRIPPAMW